MQEDDIIKNSEESYNTVNASEEKEGVTKTETVEYISVDLPESINVNVDEAFPAQGESNDELRHPLLKDRDAKDQHPISAITNLQNTLDKLSVVKNIYTKSAGLAEFRKWEDSNPEGRNRTGYFVSIVNNDGGIDICDGNHDVYGVVVASTQSGVCGYQDSAYDYLNSNTTNKANDWTYAKVCLVGDVQVRYDPSNPKNSTISIGDYVLPDNLGYAIKSDNGIGFRVSSVNTYSVSDKSGTSTMAHFVNIALVPQNDNISRVVGKLTELQGELGGLSGSFDSIIKDVDGLKHNNVTLDENFKGLEDIVDELGGSVSKVKDQLTDVETTASDAKKYASQAQEKANLAYTEAVSQANDAVNSANSALSGVKSLEDSLTYLVNWEDGDYKGISGFVQKSDDESTLIGELVKRNDDNGNSIIAVQNKIDKNGAQISNLVAHSDRYSVGPLSMSNGLSLSEAEGILYEGQIYVSTSEHTESSYIYKCKLISDITESTECYFKINDITYTFKTSISLNAGDILEYDSASEKITIGDESFDVKVAQNVDESVVLLNFVPEYVFEFESRAVYRWTSKKDVNNKDIYGWYVANDITLYTNTESVPSDVNENDLWYCWQKVSDNGYTYLPETLYRWGNEQWISVATINGNLQSRTIGLITQTDKKLSSTYTNLRGDVSNISQTVDKISTVVANVDGQVSSFQQTADQIIMGTFEPEGLTSLELLLNGFSSTSAYGQPIHTNTLNGSVSPSEGDSRYSVAPTWDDSKGQFVFDENYEDPYGTYFYYKGDKTKYCECIGENEYKVYTIGNIALASLNTRTSKNESDINSLTDFKTDTTNALTTISQKTDANSAEISAIASGEYLVCTDVKTGLTDDDLLNLPQRYTNPPKWKTISGKKQFVFNAEEINDDGLYFMYAEDSNHYYKLIYNADGKIDSYEEYAIASYGSASIMQKVTKNSSSIGMIVDNNGVKGSVIAQAVNGQSEVLIDADKIGINGTAVFRDNLRDGTTSISGNYIRTGVLTSNNYTGPVTYRMYGAKINGGKITTSDTLSDCVYYAPIENGMSYELLPQDHTYYSGSEIKSDASVEELSDKTLSPSTISGYIISTSDFDLQQISTQIEGTKIDLNVGTIFSKNLTFDREGDLSVTGRITATSGYIGNDTNGFTIDMTNPTRTYTVGEDGLEAGNYYFKHNGKYYVFEVSSNLMKDSTIVLDCDTNKLKINDGILTPIIPTDKYPFDAVYLESTLNNGAYYLANNQVSLNGDNSGKDGVFVSPTGIGLGNGKFYVTNKGDVTMKGSITLDGHISWGTSNSPVLVLYAVNSLSKPSLPYDKYKENSSTDWHTKYSTNDYFANYSYDGGNTWLDNAVRIQGENGSDASVPDYIQSTYIDFSRVESPSIKGNFVLGGSFWNSDKTAYVKLGTTEFSSNLADFTLYRSDHSRIFTIKDTTDGASLHVGDNGMFLSIANAYDTDNPSVYVKGTWNFSSCEVLNLGVVAVFGE